MFDIESNVEIPESEGNGGGAAARVYPFNKMEVGDSFFAPEGTVTPRGVVVNAYKLSQASVAYGRKHGVKFTVRKVEGGARVWRIK